MPVQADQQQDAVGIELHAGADLHISTENAEAMRSQVYDAQTQTIAYILWNVHAQL